MTDYTELKRLATRIVEVQTSQDVPISKLFDDFGAEASPETVLALIDENEALKGPHDWLAEDLIKELVDNAQAIQENADDGEDDPFVIVLLASASRIRRQEANIDKLRAENERLKAENAGLKTGYEAYERVNAELKAEVGALRKLAPSKEIIWCACGDGHAANSYGAGFMDANGGVCANCDAAMGNGGRGGQSTSKTSESAYPEGLKGGGQ